MKKPRTLRQLYRIHDWLMDRKSVQEMWRNAGTGGDFMVIPNVLTNENLQQARDYEWSMYCPNDRNPEEGEIYSSIRDVPVAVPIIVSKRYSLTLLSAIPRGTRIVIAMNSAPRPFEIAARPENVNEMEPYFVPGEFVQRPGYGGYGLVISNKEYGDSFRFESKLID